MDEQLEQRARALCAADVDAADPPVRNRQAAIDRYWLVVAAEIAGGHIVDRGVALPPDFDERQREFSYLRNHRLSGTI
jgi:hypothetical protein